MRTVALLASLGAALGCGQPPASSPSITAATASGPGAAPVPTPATQRAHPTYRHGVIVHHWLAMPYERVRGKSNVPHTYAATWFDGEDVAWIAAHGFDHLVISVDTDLWLAADGSLDEARIAPFEAALTWCRRHRLGLIANLRVSQVPAGVGKERASHLDDPRVRAARAALWERIARRFAPVGDELRFLAGDAVAGPHVDQASANELARTTVAAVRGASPDRFIYVSPLLRSDGSFIADPDASFATLADMWLPDDPRVGVSVVYSEPELFTWQVDAALPRMRFPGAVPDVRKLVAPDHRMVAASGTVHTRVEIEDDFDRLGAWRRGPGADREVYLSFIGMHDAVDALSTRTYMNAVTELAARHDVGWAVYDYESAVAVRGADGKPTPLYDGLGLTAAAARPAFTYERGVLIAHWLGGIAPRYEGQSRTPHTYAAPWFDGEDIRWIADHGFDHLQITVDAREWQSEDGRLPDAKLAPFERTLQLANAAGLGVVLVRESPASSRADRVASEWGLIAARFAKVGDGLRFCAGDDPPAMAKPGARFRAYVAAIRATSPRRFFYIPAPIGEPLEGKHSLAGTEARNRAHLRRLELDRLDEHVGIAFEYWEPQVFAFQFGQMKQRIPFPGIVPDFRGGAVAAGSYGGADDFNKLAAMFSGVKLRIEDVTDDLAGIAAAVAAEAPGRPLYLSRFGVVQGMDPLPARRYLSVIVGAARALGIGWSTYDYESGRAIRGPDGAPTVNYQGLGLAGRP
jgi:soluble cytochrome b562